MHKAIVGAILLEIQLVFTSQYFFRDEWTKNQFTKWHLDYFSLWELYKLKRIMEVDRASDSNLQGFSNFIRTDKVK